MKYIPPPRPPNMVLEVWIWLKFLLKARKFLLVSTRPIYLHKRQIRSHRAVHLLQSTHTHLSSCMFCTWNIALRMRNVTSIPRQELVSKVTVVYECAEWLTVTGFLKEIINRRMRSFIYWTVTLTLRCVPNGKTSRFMRHRTVHVHLETGDRLSRNLVWTLCHWSPAVRFNVLQSARTWETRANSWSGRRRSKLLLTS